MENIHIFFLLVSKQQYLINNVSKDILVKEFFLGDCETITMIFEFHKCLGVFSIERRIYDPAFFRLC